MKKNNEKELLREFREFSRIDDAILPPALSQTVLSRVHKDLHPSPQIVFAKLFLIHGVVGTLSMGICDQFGMSPFQTGFSLSDYFMKFGHSTCMFLCGVLFIGLTMSVGRLALSLEELRVLRKNAFLNTLGLSSISLGLFAAFGAEFAFTIGILWFLGSMVSGISIARFSSSVRHQN